MAHIKTLNAAPSLAHAKLVLAAHIKADNGGETKIELRDCEYGHIECASTLCPCCSDHAATVIEREGTDADLDFFDLKRRED